MMPAGQLTIDDAPTDTYGYTYDAVGNMATSTNGTTGTSAYTYNDANQLTAKTNTTRSFTYDLQGNQITDTGKTLTYNYDNQLKTFASGSLTTTYAYDALGNRTDKTQTGTGATNYQYVNFGNNNVLQAKNLTAGTNQYYVYGADMISQGDTASTSRQYFLDDGTGTVRYLTSSTGATTTSYGYDSYGKQLSGSTTASNYTYQNEQKDSESGYTFLRARYYDPTVGRFGSHDPQGGMVGDLASQNGYNYANNNPANLSDPSGEMATVAVGMLVGGIVGGVAGGLQYTLTTDHFDMTDFLVNAGGGAVGGIATGACLGLGPVAALTSAGCGAVGGAISDSIVQVGTQDSFSLNHLAYASAEGALGGVLGRFGAAKINAGWIALAERTGLSSSNLIPFSTTGAVGQMIQRNNWVGGAWGFGVNFVGEGAYKASGGGFCG